MKDKIICNGVLYCKSKLDEEGGYCRHSIAHEYPRGCNEGYCKIIKSYVKCISCKEQDFIKKEEMMI